MSSEASFAAACLSVGLACAWSPAAEGGAVADRVRLEYDLGDRVTHGLLLLQGPGSGGEIFIADSIALPGPGSGGFDFPFTQGTAPPTRYAMIGVYNGSTGDPPHLLVSHPGLTIIFSEFSAVFPGWSEAQLLDQLATNNPSALSFLFTNFNLISTPIGSTAGAAAFSVGFPVGTISVSYVPAPGLLGAAPLAVFAARRRRGPSRA